MGGVRVAGWGGGGGSGPGGLWLYTNTWKEPARFQGDLMHCSWIEMGQIV